MKKLLPLLLVFSFFFVACGAKTAEVKDTMKDTKKAPTTQAQPKTNPADTMKNAMDNVEAIYGPMMDKFIKEKNITIPAGENRMQYLSMNHATEWQSFMSAEAAKDPEFMKKMMEMPK